MYELWCRRYKFFTTRLKMTIKRWHCFIQDKSFDPIMWQVIRNHKGQLSKVKGIKEQKLKLHMKIEKEFNIYFIFIHHQNFHQSLHVHGIHCIEIKNLKLPYALVQNQNRFKWRDRYNSWNRKVPKHINLMNRFKGNTTGDFSFSPIFPASEQYSLKNNVLRKQIRSN